MFIMRGDHPMPDESHGLFHLGKKDEASHETPPAAPPPEEQHGLLSGVEHLLGKKEPPPPPPPPLPEKHGLLEGVEHLLGKKEPPPPPPPPPEGFWQRLFHRKPVTPEPTSPQRPALLQHVSFRSTLYIIGLVLLLAGAVPGVVDSSYRFLILAGGAILLLGGILLTGDWHPLTGMLGLRPVHLPIGGSIATKLAEREAKDEVAKLTGDSETAAPMKRVAPWHWPWSERAREAAQAEQAEKVKKYKHVGLGGKILMGIMIAVLGHGALTLVDHYLPADFKSFASFAHPAIILATIVLILCIVTAHIPTRRTHWLGPFGILRRVLIFFVVAAVAALVAGLLSHDQVLGDAYGQVIGAFAAILAILL
jgi:hypothetical protein